MDLKQLFHHPEELNDAELAQLRSKIRFQNSLPYCGGLFGGLFALVLEANFFNASGRPLRILGATAFGIYIGATGANSLGTTVKREYDSDIMKAFEQRYMTRALNVAGWNSNYTSMKDNEDTPKLNKPY